LLTSCRAWNLEFSAPETMKVPLPVIGKEYLYFRPCKTDCWENTHFKNYIHCTGI
jgi:hypothetical protein